MKSLILPLACLALICLTGACASAQGGHAMQDFDCPSSPNCVSTLAANPERRMAPVPFVRAPEDAVTAIRMIMAKEPRTTALPVSPGSPGEPLSLSYEVTSRLFGFVDVVDFRIDPAARVIHFRSASRTGYWDLGVNRARMETLREKIAERVGAAGVRPGQQPGSEGR